MLSVTYGSYFFVAFDYSQDALMEINHFFRKEHKSIVALTVKEILEEELARKLAEALGNHTR